LPSSKPIHAQTKPADGDRLNDFPALRGYLAALKKIPAGTFQMGSSAGGSDEKPVHSVTLSAFRLGATPVTFGVWKEYCAATGTNFQKHPSGEYWTIIRL
jgi:formylglycine-generating enzyme required for sulfatase activity